ncbi:hypothetical protein KSX_04430 [Ktedonospora formicarum]|uniref:Uncharacterized protein n=1 Tax=Ktedonospora formicarum TaxID=2778364 RepID=A0A8J3MNU8_9CHLR|nr:hypothetical protein KSX_04430 [Ktedonospora formicarum]
MYLVVFIPIVEAFVCISTKAVSSVSNILDSSFRLSFCWLVVSNFAKSGAIFLVVVRQTVTKFTISLDLFSHLNAVSRPVKVAINNPAIA